ncbi:SHD1 domain-containing protein [Rhodopirellula sp. JC639]|uniref:SHD1 domain-containing protein n=1 Tax=Stieleria mannarensis TaxID=2755585 RepID=UPI001602197D|nr:SHD1 domain-containing protein [Rhodopirellula sp. JC639]
MERLPIIKELEMRRTRIPFFLLLVAVLGQAAIAQQSNEREFTDASGRFRIHARVVQLSPTHVQLLKPDGTKVSVPRNRLSTQDQRYLEGLATPPVESRPLMPEESILEIPLPIPTPSPLNRNWIRSRRFVNSKNVWTPPSSVDSTERREILEISQANKKFGHSGHAVLPIPQT